MRPILLALGLFLLVASSALAQAKVPVSRYTTATVSDAEARSILEKGSAGLRIEGRGSACGLSLTLDSNVKAFTVGNGSVSSDTEFRAICNTGGYIHVVNSIGICGGSKADPGFTIIGCADTPGNCELVVRLDTIAEEESLWMHEYGHTKGLPHRKGSKLLMNPALSSANQMEVSQTECDRMKKIASASQRATAAPQPQLGVTEFVRQQYYEGLPLDEARRYTAADVPSLIRMLHDPSEARYWPNIVAVLGVIGDDKVIDELMAFLKVPTQNSPRAAYRAKLQVPVSLGYMVHERASQRALTILKKGTEPQSWSLSRIDLPDTSQAKAADAMSESSMLGLGATGNKEALKFLLALQVKRAEKFMGTLKQAISANQRVSEHGLH